MRLRRCFCRINPLIFALVIALAPSWSRAEDGVAQHRGFLTGLGYGLLIGGVAGLGAGSAGIWSASDAGSRLMRDYPTTPTPEEAPAVASLDESQRRGVRLALAGFIGGALALAGGITCLWLDGKESTNTAVSFVPTTQGGVFVLKGRF